MRDLSVIIPVFNEEKTVSKAVEKVLLQKNVLEIIIVDDGSTDRTGKILSKIKKKKIKILKHEQNFGKGRAIKTGLEQVKGELVVIQDADLEYDPKHFEKLLGYAGSKKVVFGSRLIGNNPYAYVRTYLGNVFVTKMTNWLFGSNLTDSYTGYKLLPSKIAKTLNLASDGFEIEAEITSKLLKKGVKIVEVPISYHPRKYSQGKKIRARDGLLGMWMLVKVKLGLVSI